MVKMRNPEEGIPTLVVIHPVTGKEISVDWASAVRIGKDLEKELRELPSKLAWFIELRNNAADQGRIVKEEEETAMAEVYVELKDEMGLKATETAIKTSVKANPRVREAIRARVEDESRLKRLDSICNLLIEKRWALMSLVKLRVAELAGLGDA